MIRKISIRSLNAENRYSCSPKQGLQIEKNCHMFALYIYSTGHIQCLAKIIIIKNKKNRNTMPTCL